MVLVDEAHSMGFIGEHGRGVAEAQGVIDDVDFIIGTFSKSVGTVGGFCVSNHPKFEILRLVCRPYVFTASLPPSVVATAATSIRKLMDSADKRAHLWENSKRLHAGLRQLGFTLGTDEPQSAIIAVIMPDLETGAAMWEALLHEGLYVNLARPPRDPRGHDAAALLALRAPQRRPGRRDPRHVRCGGPCNQLYKLNNLSTGEPFASAQWLTGLDWRHDRGRGRRGSPLRLASRRRCSRRPDRGARPRRDGLPRQIRERRARERARRRAPLLRSRAGRPQRRAPTCRRPRPRSPALCSTKTSRDSGNIYASYVAACGFPDRSASAI